MASFVYSVMILFAMAHVIQSQGLQKGFYSGTCSKVENIVKSSVQKAFNKDSTVAPGLLRLHFHDCFVQVYIYIFVNLPTWSAYQELII